MDTIQIAAQPLPLAAAARALGISREAVRQRIRRGSLPAKKVDNRWYVQANPGGNAQVVVGDATATSTSLDPATADGELVAVLREEVAFLRRALEEQTAALRRKDETIAALTDRLLALALPSPEPRAADNR